MLIHVFHFPLCLSGAPRHIDTEAVEKDLRGVSNVRHAHSIHIWSLTTSKAALAAHLAISEFDILIIK